MTHEWLYKQVFFLPFIAVLEMGAPTYYPKTSYHRVLGNNHWGKCHTLFFLLSLYLIKSKINVKTSLGQRLWTSLNKAMATGIVYKKKKEKQVLSIELNFITMAIWAMKRITLGLTQISRWSLIPHLPLHTHLKASLLKQVRNPGIVFMTGHILQAMCLNPHLLEKEYIT